MGGLIFTGIAVGVLSVVCFLLLVAVGRALEEDTRIENERLAAEHEVHERARGGGEPVRRWQ